ncbi:MAG: hypothetical protein EOP51_06690 [Sphingobacteriales bacterium]|nr:MAG: hypothetical protein EOP51_06690 [Sphingobacteriales bacterium]
MKFCLLIAVMFCSGMAMAQVAPGSEFKTAYTKELTNFEAAAKAGKEMDAEHSYQALLQMQQRHKKSLETSLKTAKDNDETTEITQRIEDEQNIIDRLKELAVDMKANRQEMMEEFNSFIEE